MPATVAHALTSRSRFEKKSNDKVTHIDLLFQDLGVYMRQNLTEPTRKCGALGVISHELMRNCLQRIGFSSDCIPIWEYNILNTKKECMAVSSVSVVN